MLSKVRSVRAAVIAAAVILTAVLSGAAELYAAAKTASAAPQLSAANGDAGFEAEYIDVGEGDAALIRCGSHFMLIDGGQPDQSQKLYAILKKDKIRHLDYIVCTHPHSDHAGGLPGALDYASCSLALSSVAEDDNEGFRDFLEALREHSVPLTVPEAGTVYPLGSAKITVLGPTDLEESMDANDKSLVLRIDYGKTSFLFTGDAEQEEQQLLLWNEEDELRCTVLKAAHHGSANGASYAFLAAVKPQITIISCGSGNPYGHPHEEALKLLREEKSAVFRTDLQGDIFVRSDGKSVKTQVARNRDADVFQPGAAGDTGTRTLSAAAAGAVGDDTEQSFVLNTHTMKFHLPGCKYAQRISRENRKDVTESRQELIEEGYTPCKWCLGN